MFRLQREKTMDDRSLELFFTALESLRSHLADKSSSLPNDQACQRLPKPVAGDVSFHRELPYHALLA
jgi:hypothetical protein